MNAPTMNRTFPRAWICASCGTSNTILEQPMFQGKPRRGAKA